ncbi:MAG: IS21-like element helper ATPase IstB [Saprospiraceae bacterium]
MNIIQQMNELRLAGMSTLWDNIIKNSQHHQLDLIDGLKLLLQAEKENRFLRRSDRLIQQARFRYQASIEEITFDKKRRVDKNVILSLSDCTFIEGGKSVVITGPTGVGKSFVASALGHQACNMGQPTKYYNFQNLLTSLKLARVDGSIFKLQKTLFKKSLLIIDDFGLQPLSDNQRIDFFELIEQRHNRLSTIYISQLPVKNWFDIIGENTIADAIVDRIIHQSIMIEMKGESMRKIK